MAKDLTSLKWIEQLLPADNLRKPMFGGFGYYVEDRIVLAIFEGSEDRVYKKQTFNFDIWNGCLFPVDREKHTEIKKIFPILIPHPILTKWMYLPSQTEDFENHVEKIMKEVRRGSLLFGVIPKSKKKKKITKIKKNKKPQEKIDTRIPQMFRDESFEDRLAQAKKISDLKNLGPATEKHFTKAGIKTVNQFVKLGWKKTFKKLVEVNPKNRHTLFAYALIGALKNIDWNGISAEDKNEAKIFSASLKKKK